MMNASRTTPASSDRTSYARTPFSQRTRSLEAVRACAPSPTPAMADWWASHTNEAGELAATEALTPSPEEDVVEDTVSAFRTALRQADGIDSAADLQDDAASETSDASPADSLDYFAPAFRQALDADGPRPETSRPDPSGRASKNDAESASSSVQEEAPTESLDYFTPALPSVSGSTERATPLNEAFVKMDEGGEAASEETTDPAQSLDYFAPAFRQVLGQTQDASTETTGAHPNQNDGARDLPEQPKTAAEGRPRRKTLRPSGLERSGLSDFDLDLDRLAERFFASPSHNLVGLQGS